jgi:1-acyl-sn-glycerol-3-phosphate acyltransferase
LKGIGKPFKNRYQLARFGRGGFVKLAIRARAPIIPVAVFGAEEIHPNLMRADFIGKPFGIPYMVITPTFPWLGLLGFIPLPTKWTIMIGKPVPTHECDPQEAHNYAFVNQISNRVRDEIQLMLNRAQIRRKSIFFG